MRVVFLSSEVSPFSKTGGLADVSGTLPKILAKKGIKVFVFSPYYKQVKGNFSFVKNSSLALKEHTLKFGIFEKKEKGVRFFFIKQKRFFDRDGIYGSTKGDFPDNALRFIFFQKAVLHSLKELKIKPDVFHLNDWQTSLIPVLKKNVFANIPTVLTIHNLAYQGEFSPSFAPYADLRFEELPYGRFNFLMLGLLNCDFITTVSPNYAKEILTKKFGCGLEGILRKRKNKIRGILNGIDYSVWNPEKDKFIPHRYSAKDISGKEKCKAELLKLCKIPHKKSMVASFVGRFAEQKGVEIIADALPTILKKGISFVMLADGEGPWKKRFLKIQKQFQDRFSLNFTFDEKLAHEIYAGSDVFLMPSRFEPCGLGQIIALSYGTVPVITPVGGLKDTVKPYNFRRKTGTGFFLKKYSSQSLVEAVLKANRCFKNENSWKKLVKRAITQNFSWDKSAQKYIIIYRKLLTCVIHAPPIKSGAVLSDMIKM